MKYEVQVEIQEEWARYYWSRSYEKVRAEAKYLQENGIACRVVEVIESHIIEEFPVYESNS